MKSHKRIIGLILVLSMALSMMAVGNAKYTDAPKIKYNAAVGVMTGIGAVDGKPDGSFDPAGLVTRAEAAKMVTFAVLGPAVAKQLPAGKSTFSDVPVSYWASKYIEYLVSEGIVGGRGDGSFDPAGNVTAAEMAKMLLVAAGYGKNSEYTGANWANNVIIDASSNSIFKDSAVVDYKKAATREEAALYVFNALMNVVKVSYSSVFGSYIPLTDTNKKGITIARATYGIQEPVIGIVTNNAYTGYKGTTLAIVTTEDAGPNTGKIKFIEDSSVLYKYTTELKQIGTVVKVYYKDANTVYYMDTLSKTVTSLLGATTSSAFYKTLFGTAKAAAYAVNASANYKKVTVNNYLGPTSDAFNNSNKYPKGTYAVYGGEVVSYVAFSASYIEYIDAINQTPGAETITLSSGTVVQNNAANDNATEYAGIAVGDTVCVSPAGNLFTIEKTSSVQGKISKYDAVNTGYIINGKTYSKSSAVDLTGIGFQTLDPTDFDVTDFTLYLDADGMAYGLKAATPARDIIYAVSKAYPHGSSFGITDWSVQAVNSAGEQVIYNVGSGAGSTGETNPSIVTHAGFYKVDVDNKGKAKFSAVASTDLVHSSIADKVSKTTALNGTAGGNSYYYDDNVQFIFVSGMETSLKVEKVIGTVSAGDNTLRDITAADGTQHLNAMLYYDKSQGASKSITTVIVPAVYVRPLSTGTGLLYLPGTRNNDSNLPAKTGSAGYTYNAYIDGVATSVTATNSDMTGLAGNFVNYTINGDGVYTMGYAVPASSVIVYDALVEKESIYKNFILKHSTDGVVVVDLYTDPAGGAPLINSVAAMEQLTSTKVFYIDYAISAETGAITQIYITKISDAPNTPGTHLLYLPNTSWHDSSKPAAVNPTGYVYDTYIDGVLTPVTATNSAATEAAGGFVNYSVDTDGVYTFGTRIPASADTVIYNALLPVNSVNVGLIDGHSTAGAVVVDLYTNPFSGDPMINSVAAMEALTSTKVFTVDYAVSPVTGAITQIYITAIT